MTQADIQAAISAAGRARREGRLADAGALLQAALARFGEQPSLLNALGVQALAEGRPADAAGLFRRAIEADSGSPELWMNLAKAHREAHDGEGERAALDGALAIDQTHFMALVRMAELHERLGEDAQAVERWRGVLALAAGMEERMPAIEAMLEHARDRVARHHASYAAQLEDGLADARAGLTPSERRRFDACVDHVLGRRQVYANRCAGMHYPFLPADEFFERAHFPWLDTIEARTDVIRAELEALLASEKPGLLPYVSMEPGTPVNKWSPLDGSLDWSAVHLWKDGKRDDAVCARVPQTAAAVEALPLCDLPGRTPTVFFSILRPGAHLPAHTGVSNVRTIIHLPLIVPPDCALRVGGETREWRVGQALAFDDTIEHEAWNRSNALRAVLIFDVWNPYLTDVERDLLRRFYAVTAASGRAGDAAVSLG